MTMTRALGGGLGFRAWALGRARLCGPRHPFEHRAENCRLSLASGWSSTVRSWSLQEAERANALAGDDDLPGRSIGWIGVAGR
jgi:hypothetical protein